MSLFQGYWPWWVGAIGLAALTVGFFKVMGATMGISGSVGKLCNARQEHELAKLEGSLAEDPRALDAALLAATLAQFGGSALPPAAAPPPAEVHPPVALPRRIPPSAHLTFLLSIGGGGLLAALSSDTFSVNLWPTQDYARVVAGGGVGLGTLLLGGLLVGVGTSMAGGCTSGLGLSGCGRLQPGSLAATAAFFGTGVAVSLVLARFM